MNNFFDKQCNKLINLYQTTIFDKLKFDNWTGIIYSAKIIITPECGCSHIAAICKIHAKIIYDAYNKPEMINAEYAPWNSSYEKFIFNDFNLNGLLIKKL